MTTDTTTPTRTDYARAARLNALHRPSFERVTEARARLTQRYVPLDHDARAYAPTLTLSDRQGHAIERLDDDQIGAVLDAARVLEQYARACRGTSIALVILGERRLTSVAEHRAEHRAARALTRAVRADILRRVDERAAALRDLRAALRRR